MIFHLTSLSFSLSHTDTHAHTHRVMIYNYRLIRGRFARPDRRIVAFRVCILLVSDDAPYSNFCAPFKTGLTINGYVAVHPRISWIRSIVSRSEQAILIPRFIRVAGNTRPEDLCLSLSLFAILSFRFSDDSIRAQVRSGMLE